MSDEIVLSTKINLQKAIESLQKFHDELSQVSQTFKAAGDQIDQNFNSNVKKTESFIDTLGGFARRLTDQIRRDFKSLVSLESLSSGLKLSSQFKGSITQTVALSDAIRKLSSTFGIGEKDFSRFQTSLTKGLGEIGLSSDVAARTLEGLSQTQVRGEGQLVSYSKAAGQLASIGREVGREGDIARMIAKVIQTRGGNVNDVKEMDRVSKDVLAVRQTTGMAPTEILGNMQKLFEGMSSDFRKSISSKGLATIAGAAGVAGPNATSFVESFLKLGKTQRAGLEARGVGNLFSDQGFNADQVKAFASEAEKLGGGDMRLGLKAMGIESDEAAEGFLRLRDNLDQVIAAQNKIQNSSADLTKTYQQSLGMGEAFNASINRVKRVFAEPLSAATQGLTGALGGAAGSDAGALGVVAGGGLLATLLAGGGLRGVGSGLGIGGMAKAKAEEAITGEKVIPVRVVNASEIGGGGVGGGTGMLGKAGLVGAAAVGGAALGDQVLNPLIDKFTQGKTSEGFEGNAVERLIFKLDQVFGGENAKRINQAQTVRVEVNKRDLKEMKVGNRGTSQ